MWAAVTEPGRLVRWIGVTTSTFAHVRDDPELASSVGPGWDDCYPAQSDHYRAAFSARAA